jgi:hypothetical protein
MLIYVVKYHIILFFMSPVSLALFDLKLYWYLKQNIIKPNVTCKIDKEKGT